LNGEYGLTDVFIGVPCRLGCRGVETVLEVKLTDAETESLHLSAQSVRKNVDLALQGLGLAE
jgi:malate dehydrogenase